MEELTEKFGLLISKQMLKALRKILYEQRDKYTSLADIVRQAIQERLNKEKEE